MKGYYWIRPCYMIIYFFGAEDESECCMALGYISIYNHDYHSNAEYEMDFALSLIRITLVSHIKKGEEIFINYNGTWNDSRPVWFDIGQTRLNSTIFLTLLAQVCTGRITKNHKC